MGTLLRAGSGALFHAIRRPSERLMFAAFGVYCFVFPFAVVLLSFDWMPFGMEWMSSLLLAMLGITSAAWLWTNYGLRGLALSLAVLVLGIALEYVGVQTGFPFGPYRYTGVLVPELPGGVPVAIGFAWLLVVVGGLFTALQLSYVRPRRLNGFPAAAAGAVLAVGLDLLLEPVAFHIKNYWQWLTPGAGYYGIPWRNFASWLVAAFLLSLLVLAVLRPRGVRSWRWLPVVLLAMNIFMFGVVNAAHGYWVSGAVGLLLLVLITPALPRWVRTLLRLRI